jgi:hypothetical protein
MNQFKKKRKEKVSESKNQKLPIAIELKFTFVSLASSSILPDASWPTVEHKSIGVLAFI